MLAPAGFPVAVALLSAGHLALAAPFPPTAHLSHGVTIVGGQGDMVPLRSTSSFLLKRPDDYSDDYSDDYNQVEDIDEKRPVVKKPPESPWYEYETAEEDSALVWPLDTEGLVARGLTTNRKGPCTWGSFEAVPTKCIREWEEARRRPDQEEEIVQEEEVTQAIKDAKDAEAKKVLEEERMAALDERCSKWYSILYVPPMIECIGWEPPWARPGWKGPASLPESVGNEQQSEEAGAKRQLVAHTLAEDDDETIAHVKGPGPVIVDDSIGHVEKEAVDADGIVGSIGPVVIGHIDEA